MSWFKVVSGGFAWFWVVSGWFQLVLNSFRLLAGGFELRVICCFSSYHYYLSNHIPEMIFSIWYMHILQRLVVWTFSFSKEASSSPSFSSFRFPFFLLLLIVLIIYRSEIFLVFSFLWPCFTTRNRLFTNITSTEFEENLLYNRQKN